METAKAIKCGHCAGRGRYAVLLRPKDRPSYWTAIECGACRGTGYLPPKDGEPRA